MKLSAREQKLMLVLPAIGVLLGYLGWYSFYERQPAAQAQREHEATQAAAVPSTVLAAQRAALAKLQREAKDLEQSKAKLDREVAATRTRELPASSRLDADQALADLFRRHHLALLAEDVRNPNKADAARLPTSLGDALKRLGQKDAAKLGELRTYKLAGRFLNVLHAVGELAEQAMPAGIPVGLTMDAADSGNDEREWTLVLWM